MLARRSLLIFGTNVLGALTGMVGLFFIGRYMTPESLGMLAFALSLVGVASFAADMGFDTAHVKRVSEGRDLGRAMATYRVLKLGLTAAFAALIVVAVLTWHAARGFTDAVTLPVLLIMVLYYVALELRKIPERTFTGLRQTAKTQVLVAVEFLVKTPAVVAVALVFGFVNGDWVPFRGLAGLLANIVPADGPLAPATGAAWLAWAHVAGMVASLFVGWALLRWHRYPSDRFDADLARDYRRFAMPTAVFSALALLSVRIDTLFVGYFWSATEVGWYYAAQRVTTILLVIPTAVRTIFFPLISELAARGEKSAVHEVAVTTQRLVGLVMIGGSMLMVLYPTEGIHIFLDDSFLEAAGTVQILVLFTLILSFSSVGSSIVMGFDHPRAIAVLGGVNVGVHMVLATLLVPTSILGVPLAGLGAEGAALSSLGAQVVHLVVISMLARRYTGSAYLSVSVLKHVAAAGLAGVVLHATRGAAFFGGLDRYYELALAGLVGALLYAAGLALMRELGRKDVVMVLDLVHPGKMAGYVREELGRRRP